MLSDTQMNTDDKALVTTITINKNIETKYFIDSHLHNIWNDILTFATKQNKKENYLSHYDPFAALDHPNVNYHRMVRDDDIENDKNFEYTLNYGLHELIINNSQVLLNYIKTSPPIPLCDRITYKEELYFIVKLFPTHKENIKFIENFIEKLCYDKLKSLDKQIKIYVNDETYWRLHGKITKRNIDTVYLENKDMIIDDIKQFYKSEELYRNEGRPYKRNYLLYGPPGTGKSSLITAIASTMNLNIYKINIVKGFDDTQLMTTMAKIPKNGILILEDIDNCFPTEEESDKKNSQFVTFSTLLNILDGFAIKENLITLMTTNHKDRLSEAFLRPGRVDMLLEFTYLNVEQLKCITEHYIKDNTIKEDFIQKVKNIKSTSACITKFLFEHCMVRKIENINDDSYIKIYENLCKQYNNPDNMYI